MVYQPLLGVVLGPLLPLSKAGGTRRFALLLSMLWAPRAGTCPADLSTPSPSHLGSGMKLFPAGVGA